MFLFLGEKKEPKASCAGETGASFSRPGWLLLKYVWTAKVQK